MESVCSPRRWCPLATNKLSNQKAKFETELWDHVKWIRIRVKRGELSVLLRLVNTVIHAVKRHKTRLKRETLLPLPRIELRFLGHSARSLVTIQTLGLVSLISTRIETRLV
jgi:hypothetical protein